MHHRKARLHSQVDNKALASQLIASQSELHNIKPFVSLEISRTDRIPDSENPMPASSGIAIITLLLSGEATYSDSTAKTILLKKNDVMWTLAGSGILHSLTPTTQDCVSVTLMLALSPALEKAPAQSLYLESNLIESDGPAHLLLGRYKEALSLFALPALINYLIVHLDAGQSWNYESPANHSIAWIAVLSGKVYTGDTEAIQGELFIYEKASAPIVFFAEENSVFLLGSSVEYAHEWNVDNNFNNARSTTPDHKQTHHLLHI